MQLSALLGFAGIALVVVLTPGPDTFLLLRYALNRPRNGVAAAAGMMVSIMGWAALAGIGVAALLKTYPVVHQGIAVLGGLYLLYLGLGTLLKARFLAGASPAPAQGVARSLVSGTGQFTIPQSFRAGMLSSALNPKLGLLFLALMPPFIPAGSNLLASALLLGLVYTVIGFAYLMALTLVAARAVAWFKGPAVGSWMERISSGALAVMGVVVLVGAFASQ